MMGEKLPQKPLFKVEEIYDLLKEMKTYYMDGEIESDDGYILSIEITKDSAGEDGWVYGWDLGKVDEFDNVVWIKGDCYFYSDNELIESLLEHGIIE